MWQSGLYNRTMASVIVGALFTNEFYGVVPAMPVRPEEAEDYEMCRE